MILKIVLIRVLIRVAMAHVRAIPVDQWFVKLVVVSTFKGRPAAGEVDVRDLVNLVSMLKLNTN
jgi:hypothetical protein